MKTFVILTAAINRPELHDTSIGHFYRSVYGPHKEYVDRTYSIVHIINIDRLPNPLLPATQQDTRQNLERIIPPNVRTIFNETNADISPPSFLGAYRNLLALVAQHDLVSDEHVYWWFEDDWFVFSHINFFRRVERLLSFGTTALSMTSNHQLGSFRGGPVMEGAFFRRYFNMLGLGVLVEKRNPERQYCSYMRGTRCYAEKGPAGIIHRSLSEARDQRVNIILVHISTPISKISEDFGRDYYRDNFHPCIDCHFYIVRTDEAFDQVQYIDCSARLNGWQALARVRNPREYTQGKTLDEFAAGLRAESGGCATLVLVKKFVIDDVGRPYMQKLAMSASEA